ncbi:hypothetical protein [Streptomyces sp. NPDC049813]|uniref:hypothetical protein n=1 Tax=Streptomyces sp. NPDC049813 TaxID=3365597 RepID=UPI003787A5FE
MDYPMPLTHRLRRRRLTALAICGIALWTLSACSGGDSEREYSMPQSLCGTKIDTKELGKFLPAGKKITVTSREGDANTRHCDVHVDSKLAFLTTQSWWESGSTTARFASGQTLDTPDKSAEGGTYLYSGYQAFGAVKDCRNTKHADQQLFTGLQANDTEERDADAMHRLITSYTQAVQTSGQCQ